MKNSPERLALTHQLEALVIDYWHDVDTNWGENAPNYYTEDGVFKGTQNTYQGREKIRAFYKWRKDRGARTVIHSVSNFRAFPDGPDKATCHWILMLYAAGGAGKLSIDYYFSAEREKALGRDVEASGKSERAPSSTAHAPL